jgi:polar amino acid transport system permease protein
MFRLLERYQFALLSGALETLKICGIVWVSGLALGALLGLAAANSPKILGRLVHWITFLVTSIPALVILFWFHYPFQSLAGIVVDPFWTTIVVLSLINIMVVAEAVQVGVVAVPKEMRWTAKAAGLSDFETYTLILFPLGIRLALPSVIMAQVAVVHMSIFASLISVNELFRTVQTINGLEYQPVGSYSIVAIFFVAICLPLGLLGLFLRARLDFGISRSDR